MDSNLSKFNSTCVKPFYDYRLELFPIGVYAARVLLPIITLVGIFGNVVSFMIWISPKLRRDNSSAIYLAAISLSDLFLLCVGIFYYIQIYYCPSISSWFGYCEVYLSFYYFLQNNSIPLVFAFTLERWVSICYPFARDRLFSPKRSYIAIGIIALIMYAQSLGYCTIFKYNPASNECIPKESLFQVYIMYSRVQETIVNICVPLCILVLNILVIRELYRITEASRLHAPSPEAFISEDKEPLESSRLASQNRPNKRQANSTRESRRESASFRSTTIMLLSVSFYLIISVWMVSFMYLLQYTVSSESCERVLESCMPFSVIKHLPVCSPFITFHTVKTLVDIFGMTHFSSNFFIYFITGKNFRDKAIELLWTTRCGTRSSRYEDGFTTVTLRETNAAANGNAVINNSTKLGPKSSARPHRYNGSQISSVKCDEL